MNPEKKFYLVCDRADAKALSIKDAPEIGVEFMGMCHGRVLLEDGTEVGSHTSSSIGWLRKDLSSKIPQWMNTFMKYPEDAGTQAVIVDLIEQPVPDRFKKTVVVHNQ